MAWACIHVVSVRASEDVCTYVRAPSTVHVSQHYGTETKKEYMLPFEGEENLWWTKFHLSYFYSIVA